MKTLGIQNARFYYVDDLVKYDLIDICDYKRIGVSQRSQYKFGNPKTFTGYGRKFSDLERTSTDVG